MQEQLIDQGGLSFVFEINGIRIFCGGLSSFASFSVKTLNTMAGSGSNWIPADSFPTSCVLLADFRPSYQHLSNGFAA